MNNQESSLKELLARLHRAAGYGPPTPEEADTAMESAMEKAGDDYEFDDDRILEIARAVVRGERPSSPSDEPPAWNDQYEPTETEAGQYAGAFRNEGDIDDETQAKIDEAEREALEDDDDNDDEAGLEDQKGAP